MSYLNFNPEDNDEKKILLRSAKLSEISAVAPSRYVYMIQAAPGAGKTVFARQIAEHMYDAHIWYTITDSDKDPLHLCRKLYAEMKNVFPKFVSAEFEAASESGLEPLFYETYIKNIIKDLKKHSRKKTVIVFDDAHLLPRIGLACKTVKTAIGMASANMHFISCARRVCNPVTGSAKLDSLVYEVNDEFLRFTQKEFKSLCVMALKETADFSGLEAVYAETEGWAHGIRNALSIYSANEKPPTADELADSLKDYFDINHLPADSNKVFNSFMLLSLLDEINLEFAIKNSGSSGIANYMVSLLDNYHFIYRSSTISFRLHHIFKKWLNKKCHNTLNKNDIDIFLNQAADFEIEKNNSRKALQYLIKAKTYTRLEQVIMTNIDMFITSDTPKELCAILSDIPSNVMRNSLWMPLAYSLAVLNASPEKSGRMFMHILDSFVRQKDKTGEMLCRAGIVFHHTLIDSNAATVAEHHRLLNLLLDENRNSFTDVQTLFGRTASLLGCLYHYPKCKSGYSLEETTKNAEQLNIRLLKHILYLQNSIMSEMSSMIRLSLKYQNKMLNSKHSKSENSYITLLTYMALYLYLALNGHKTAQKQLSMKIREKFRLYLDMIPHIRMELDAFDADNATSSGDYISAKNYLEPYTSTEMAEMPDFLYSVIESYKNIVSAMEFEENAADENKTVLSKSCELNISDFFLAHHYFLSGVVNTMLSRFKAAENTLKTSLKLAQSSGNDIVTSASYAYLSFLNNSAGKTDAAAEYATASVMYLRKVEKHSFWCASADVMQNLFSYAYKHDALKEYIRHIAVKHYRMGFDSNGDIIPLMEINAFGEISISIGSKTLPSDLLSGNFRLMIAILLSSTDFSLHQEVMQSYIWPSSSKEHARRSFDNLLSRFRKILSDNFMGTNPKEYITINNGIVKLVNTRCSADEFIKSSNEASAHMEKGDLSSCIRLLLEIKDSYTDRYCPHINGSEKVDARRQYADLAFIKMITLIRRVNIYLPDIIPLERYFSQWLDIYMHETDMVKTAYGYYRDRQKTVKCAQILKNYRSFLLSEGFTDEESDELIFGIKSSA